MSVVKQYIRKGYRQYISHGHKNMASHITYPSHSKQCAGRFHAIGVRILVTEVDHLLDAALDDCLGTLVAGKQPHIDLRASI